MSKWPIIRHVRWLYLTVRFNIWWSSMGQLFVCPNQSDLDYLDGVWEGKY